MRLTRLEISGFGAFRDPTTIDFTDTDFFALVGPTGSGKSTVIDAVCFSLLRIRTPLRGQAHDALRRHSRVLRVAACRSASSSRPGLMSPLGLCVVRPTAVSRPRRRASSASIHPKCSLEASVR